MLVYAMAPWLATSALNIDPALQSETLRSFRAVAWCLPVLITVTGLVGTLEACHRFPLVVDKKLLFRLSGHVPVRLA